MTPKNWTLEGKKWHYSQLTEPTILKMARLDKICLISHSKEIFCFTLRYENCTVCN